VTDAADGYAARATGQTSTGGKIYDPFADSVYRITIFLAFVSNDWMPLWMVYVCILRDIVVANLRLVSQESGVTVAARTSGKIKAISQAIAQVTLIVIYALYGSHITPTIFFATHVLLFLATMITFYSLVDYILSLSRSDQ
jgi:CDP-diacylglycerol--glycerol-3-phosphate 3-phosphatidyltransferase